MDIFEEAEASAPDNQREWADLIWSSVPVLETLPVDEMFFLVDWYFANQMTDYQADYTTTWVDEAACILYCNVVANDCVLDYETLGNSLSQLRAAFPGNKAADIYARFGDATTPTLGTQIGMFINEIEGGGAGTLKDFFYNLIQTFGIGAQSENPGYSVCDCPQPWDYDTDYTEGANGWLIGSETGVTGAGGELVLGVGIVSTDATGSENAFVLFELVEAFTGTVTCQIKYNLHVDLSFFFADAVDALGDPCGYGIFPDETQGDGLTQSVTFDVVAATKFRIDLNGQAWDGTSHITLIEANWSGMPDPNPFTGV
jgi:hypothetical protein